MTPPWLARDDGPTDVSGFSRRATDTKAGPLHLGQKSTHTGGRGYGATPRLAVSVGFEKVEAGAFVTHVVHDIDSALLAEFIASVRRPPALPPLSEFESPPSAAVVDLARRVWDRMAAAGLGADRSIASPEGDIVYCFFAEAEVEGSAIRFASIRCADSGVVVLFMADKARDYSDAEEFAGDTQGIDTALAALRAFLGKCPVL